MPNLHRCATAAALGALFAIATAARVDTANPGQQWPASPRTGLAGRIDTPPADRERPAQSVAPASADPLEEAQRSMIDVRAGRSARWAVAGDDWIAIGPNGVPAWGSFVMNGPMVGVVAHPTQKDTYVAFPRHGGVLKTTDAGTSWTWLNETLFSAAAVADPRPWVFDPRTPSVVYSFQNPKGDAGRLLRSDDGGATFRTIWTSPNAIKALAADPRPLPSGQTRLLLFAWPDIVDLAGDGTEVRYAAQKVSNFSSLQFSQKNPDFVFSSGNGGVILRSTDGGRRWTASYLPGSDAFGVAVGAGDPPTLYAAQRTRDYWASTTTNVFRSDNAGETWAQTWGEYDLYDYDNGAITADPSDPSTVYLGTSRLLKSTDGGRTFRFVASSNSLGYNAAVHDAAGRMIVASDSGVFRADATGVVPLNRGFCAMGFTQVDVDPTQPSTLYAMNDVAGAHVFRGPLGWFRNPEEDAPSAFALEPRSSLLHVYSWPATGAWSHVWVHRCSTSSPWQDCAHYDINFSAVGRTETLPAFHTVMAAAPWPPSTLYLLNRWLSRSTDQGATWTTSGKEFQTNCRRLTNGQHCEAAGRYGNLTALSFSESRYWTLAVGGSKGYLYWSTDDGAQWTEAWLNLPYRPVTDIAIHPYESRVGYATYGGYNADDPTKTKPYAAGHVFKTTDSGANWVDISGNLPDVPVNSIVVDMDTTPSILYVGTDVGVFRVTDGESAWQVFGRGLPPVKVTDLAWNRKTRTLAAATLGRGVFVISDRIGR